MFGKFLTSGAALQHLIQVLFSTACSGVNDAVIFQPLVAVLAP